MHGLFFKRIPRIVTRGVVVKVIKDLNQLPAIDCISGTMSTLSIMTGKTLLDCNNILIEIGTYVHVFENNEPTNTTKARTTPTIAMDQTVNAQGGYLFMSLATGSKLERQQ